MPYPPLPARLKIHVAGGRPGQIKIHCGARDCGTFVAAIAGTPSDIELPHEHTTEWLDGFRRGSDGIVVLIPRAREEWERAKRQNVSWKAFVGRRGLRARTPYRPAGQSGLPAGLQPYYRRRRDAFRSVHGPGTALAARTETTCGPVTFVCPVCGRANLLGIPEVWEQGDRCPYCQPDVPPHDGEHAYAIPVDPAG